MNIETFLPIQKLFPQLNWNFVLLPSPPVTLGEVDSYPTSITSSPSDKKSNFVQVSSLFHKACISKGNLNKFSISEMGLIFVRAIISLLDISGFRMDTWSNFGQQDDRRGLLWTRRSLLQRKRERNPHRTLVPLWKQILGWCKNNWGFCNYF